MIIIGDIHGCYKTLKELLSRYPNETDIYTVGDLIDRGPKSQEVVQMAIDMGFKSAMGNHEHMLIDYIERTDKYENGVFLYNGGTETLRAYGGNDIPIEHLEYFAAMPFYLDIGKYFISHAGIRPDLSLKESCEDSKPDIIWNRLGLKELEDKVQVIGHTPGHVIQYREGYVNIDTGCIYPNFGHLTALIIDEEGDETHVSIPCID